MLGLLQTIFSIAVSWIVSDLYAKYQYQKDIADIKKDYQSNLKTYALKASEKVDNLSNELSKLALYLQEEIDSDSKEVENDLLSKKERMQSAIHIINTLKSVNDKSLSDWRGVISEELDKRLVESEQLMKVLSSVNNKYNDLLEKTNAQNASESDFSEDIKDIKKTLDYLTLSRLGVSPLKRKTQEKKPVKEEIDEQCPICKNPIRYTQRRNINGFKIVKCNACNESLLSRWNPEFGFELLPNNAEEVASDCVRCGAKMNYKLGIFPYSKIVITCSNCKSLIEAVRKINEIKIKSLELTDNSGIVDEEMIDLVKSSLPIQPWPTGTAKDVAKKLGFNSKDVSKIIAILIDRGDFKMQINGKLFEPSS
jgi:hypothetical protein